VQNYENTRNLQGASIFINDDLYFALNALIFKITEVKRKHNIKLLVIHGCDLLTDNEHNKLSKQQEQDLIASKMKQLVVDENIAIIITHELPEIMQPYNNEEVLPSLKEVYEDTPIAKYADLVTFLYRPEYYGFKTWYHTNESSEAEADLMIVKNRHGNLNNFRLSFDGYSSQFTEVDDIFFENTTTVS
jgi:replicative DNA helicase